MYLENLEDAEGLLLKARRIMEDAYGSDDPPLRSILDQTVSLYLKIGQDDEAAQLQSAADALHQ